MDLWLLYDGAAVGVGVDGCGADGDDDCALFFLKRALSCVC